MEIPNERSMRFVYARYRVAEPMSANLARTLPVMLAELQANQQEAGKYSWTIGDIGERTIAGEKLLFGRLGKTARATGATSGGGSIHSSGRKSTPGKKAACSNFFIDPQNSIMALEDKPLLPAEKFLKKFKQFWETTQTAEIDFDFLQNEPEIFAAINQWDRITAARFELSSAHACPREELKQLNDLLRHSKASRAVFKFEGGASGLARDNSIIQEGVSLSAAGYGKFGLKGVADGAKTALDSDSFLLANDLVEVDDLPSLAPVILAAIRKIPG